MKKLINISCMSNEDILIVDENENENSNIIVFSINKSAIKECVLLDKQKAVLLRDKLNEFINK